MSPLKNKNCKTLGNSLAVLWLGLHAFTAKGPGSSPGWGTKILQAAWCSWKKKVKKKIAKPMKRDPILREIANVKNNQSKNSVQVKLIL